MKRSSGSYPKHRERLREVLGYIEYGVVPLNLIKNFIQVLRDLPERLREPSITWHSPAASGESLRLCITVGYGHFNKWEAEFYQQDGEIYCWYKIDQDHWTRAEGTDRVLEFTKLPYVLELLSETHCLWTVEEEKQEIAEQGARQKEFNERMDKECAGMSPTQRLGHVMAAPLRRELLYDSSHPLRSSQVGTWSPK